jgi:hypothetical protein
MRGLKFRGRPPIKIADSVKSVVTFTDPYAATIRDRRISVDEDFVDAIVGQSIMTWEGRNPSPALDPDGNFIATDLDLLSFMCPLVQRGAVIEFPFYQSHRASPVRANERRISTPSRFGVLTNMTSNREYFSMSARMVDQSVIASDPADGHEKPGAFRNFMVVGPDGLWHDGWKKIIFNPTAEENRFITEKRLWSGGTVYFKNAVHPNRKQSIFSAHYYLLKMLYERLEDERKFAQSEVDRLKTAGVQFSEGEGPKDYGPSEPSGALQEKVTITCFEAVIDMPDFEGSYAPYPDTPAGLAAAYNRANELKSTLKPKAQFTIRASELAYHLHGKQERWVAPWMEGRSFKPYKVPRGRVVWEQIVLSNDVSYRWRECSRTDTTTVRFQVAA